MDTWQMIREERAALVDALAGLPDADWDRQSLCAGYTVRDVVAHLIATTTLTPPGFFLAMLRNRFNFNAMARAKIDEIIDGRSHAELIELYRSKIDSRTAPPGPTTSWLGETIVHGEDIFRALGGYRAHPAAHVVAVCDFYKGSNLLIDAKNRIAGVRLRATDTDWQHGDGPEAAGPVLAILLAMTGRKVALDDLTGDGVAVLRGRP